MRDAIIAACGRLTVSISDKQAYLLSKHLEMVLDGNRKFNLTAITDVADAIVLHVVDSLMVLPEISSAPEGPIADIGTGPGFPGIPLAVMTGRRVDLVESIGKKARFLETVVDTLELCDTVKVINERAEQLASHTRGAYGAVTARAVTSLPALVELSAPLLRLEGILVSLKGRVGADELDSGAKAAAMVGLTYSGIRKYTLLDHDAARSCVTYTRTGSSSIQLPRRAGLAQRKPLA